MTTSFKQKLIFGFDLCINGLLFSLISLLNTYNANASQVVFPEIFRPFLVSFFILFLLGLIIMFFTRSSPKAALILFITSVLVFSYGHILYFFEDIHLDFIAKHRILVPAFALVYVISTILITRQKNIRLSSINHLITRILSLFLLLNFVIFGFELFQNSQNDSKKITNIKNLPVMTQAQMENLPDIYWFILDGYERKDALQDHYGYDNSDFLDELAKRDFIIPKCTLSNYGLTALTISTSLNMDYINKITSEPFVKKDHLDYRIFKNLISQSEVKNILKYYGYETVAFKTEYAFTELRDAEYYIQPKDKSFFDNFLHPVLLNFEEEFLGTTLGKVILDMPVSLKEKIFKFIENPVKSKFELVNYNFSMLKKVPDITGRKFVFAHIMTPHDPFVIDRNGNFAEYEDTKQGYIDSIIATNHEMLLIIDQILKKSKVSPVIIIQGDHAYSEKDRTKILNTYFLPGIDAASVDVKITPVNTFRMILQHYFNIPIDLIENRSFSSSEKSQPANLIEVPNTCFK